ncbi:MAG: 2-C-methyl-D-erythritol 4-phosphate cytidylyltransferase [Candidatus Coatesbacteria bacterium]|nr:MAG: 2-C-methyl-D-erythritol 4-phosphate cytidylyltransferase [Candidatus Coatesbacteria bacterium]
MLSSGLGNKAVALILAAGASSRMEGVDKSFAPLAGKTVLTYSVELFAGMPEVNRVVITVAAESIDRVKETAEPASAGKLAGVVEGGAERQDSARNGLRFLADIVSDESVVLIHDAARPLADAGLARRVLEAVPAADGVVPVIPVDDTIKRADVGGAIEATLYREFLRAVQTPQGFELGYILDLHERAAAEDYRATDDAALVERYGGRVVTVEGGVANIKITRSLDLKIAEAILGGST